MEPVYYLFLPFPNMLALILLLIYDKSYDALRITIQIYLSRLLHVYTKRRRLEHETLKPSIGGLVVDGHVDAT